MSSQSVKLHLTGWIWLLLPAVSAPAMGAFVFLFLRNNQAAFTNFPALALIGAVYVLLYAGICGVAGWRISNFTKLRSAITWRLAGLLCASLLIWLFLDSTVLDYYQPLSLHDDAITALALSWVGLVVVLVLAAGLGVMGVSLLSLALVALGGVPMLWLAASINDPQPNPELADHQTLFVGGQDGYAVYRIPALLVLPRAITLASGETLGADRVLAFAEARRDGALDTGVIDLVLKSSNDAGATWTRQKVVCRHERAGQRGKCGNPTPVFDRETGTVFLAYNLTGIGKGGHQAVVSRSRDGGKSWEVGMAIADENLVFGPGHGLQKVREPASGRLLLPGYSNAAELTFSDDHGATWQRGRRVDTGNETQVAELADGRLYLNTRHNAPIGQPPFPYGRLYSNSTDGGYSWQATRIDEVLLTPVCQASVLGYGESGLLFSNPADARTRARMTLRYSPDGGQSWPWSMQVFPGPAGYSDLGVLSSGDVLVLYEGGRMSYSEQLMLARVSAVSIGIQFETLH